MSPSYVCSEYQTGDWFIITKQLYVLQVETTMPSVPVLGLRRSARALRRAGKRKSSAPRSVDGEKPAPNKSIGNASLLGALADILCVNFFLAWLGLQVTLTYSR